MEGNYRVASVQPGTYIVNVEKEGYLTFVPYVLGVFDRYTQEQQKALLGVLPQVTVMNGGASRADIVLHRGGAIMGRVSFDSGGPWSHADITATLVSAEVSIPASNAKGPDLQNYRPTVTTTTDDRGFYRFAGLLPGKYLIDAEVREGLHISDDSKESAVGRVWVYAPGALSETHARLMEVGEGDEIPDADITIPTGRLHAIGGLITLQGAPLADAHVSVHRDGEKEPRYAFNAISASDGSYRIDLLPPGTYDVKVEYYDKRSLRHVEKETTVQLMDDDVADANVDLPLQPAAQ